MHLQDKISHQELRRIEKRIAKSRARAKRYRPPPLRKYLKG